MIKEFEGKTEEEAVAKAAEEFGIDESGLDVEVIDGGKNGLFFKKPVRIRVSVDLEDEEHQKTAFEKAFEEELSQLNETQKEPQVDPETAEKITAFLKEVLSLMGYEADVSSLGISGSKLTLGIESEDSSIIIGRKGRNLDALQTVCNAYAKGLGSNCRVVLDSENYRLRRERQIVRLACRVAMQVKKTGRSQLLDPMNPYERRLVHTALNDMNGIETKSEGEGLFRQVRISCSKKVG